jgi:hypothetical protein
VNSVTGATSEQEKAAAIETAKAALAGSYAGPTTVKHDIGNTDAVKQAQALGNAQSAGKQLASLKGPTGTYGTGLSAIDAAIYGSQDNADTMKGINDAAKGQVEGQIAKKSSLESDAGVAAENISKGAAGTRAAFQARADALQQEARAKATQAQAANDALKAAKPVATQAQNVFRADTSNANYMRQKNAAGNYIETEGDRARGEKDLSDEQKEYFRQAFNAGLNATEARRQAVAYKPSMARTDYTWQEGSGLADASQFYDINQLNAIGSVLGDETLQGLKPTGQYKAGKWNTSVYDDAGKASNNWETDSQYIADHPDMAMGNAMDENGNEILTPAAPVVTRQGGPDLQTQQAQPVQTQTAAQPSAQSFQQNSAAAAEAERIRALQERDRLYAEAHPEQFEQNPYDKEY